MEKKFIKLTDIRTLNKQVSLGDISSSKMIEIINEKADEYAKMHIENFKIEQLKKLLEIFGERKVIAYEWHNEQTGHAIVDYDTECRKVLTENGYTKKPLIYKQTMKHYYLINGSVKVSDSKMPENHEQARLNPVFAAVENNLFKHWHLSLQPCEIDESEMTKIMNSDCKEDVDMRNPIDITDIVLEKDGKIYFKPVEQPKQVNKRYNLGQQDFKNWYYDYCDDKEEKPDAESIYNFIEKYLQPKQVCSDAVEFAEWITSNCVMPWSMPINEVYYVDSNSERHRMTIKEVYQIFKTIE